MKSSVVILLGIIFWLASPDVRAQETPPPDDPPDTEVARAEPTRTPALVVYEPATLPEPAKAATPGEKDSKQVAVKQGKNQTGKQSDAAASSSAPPPLVLPGTRGQSDGLVVSDTTGNPKYDELVLEAATRYGVDPDLVFAIMRQESGFKTRALSPKGASGLMQLMPATARRFGVKNIWDPAENIDAGTRYLRFLLDTFNGDVELALAGYNAGENAVIRYGYTIPRYRETQNYVRSITARYSRTKSGGRIAQSRPAPDPVAPEAMQFGAGGRLSNNY